MFLMVCPGFGVDRENKESVVPQGHQDLHHTQKKKEAKS